MLHYTLRLHTHARQLFIVVVANDVQRICEVCFQSTLGSSSKLDQTWGMRQKQFHPNQRKYACGDMIKGSQAPSMSV